MTAKTASKAKKVEKKEKAVKPAVKPVAKAKVAEKTVAKPATKPTTKPVEKPEVKVVAKPVVKPEVKVAPKAEAKVAPSSAKAPAGMPKAEQPKVEAPKIAPKAAPAPVKPSVVAKPAQAAQPKTQKTAVAGKGSPVAHAVGRRKAAVARVWLRRNGSGKITVNDMPANQYFSTDTARRMIKVPSTVAATAAARYDVDVNVYGGGVHGQADAVKLAISRALVKADEAIRPALKEKGLLRVDARVVERKKYGQKKARRRFQFVKR